MNPNARIAVGFFLVTLPCLVMEFCPHNFSVWQFLPTLVGLGVLLRLTILQYQYHHQQQQDLDLWISRLKGVVIVASIMALFHVIGVVVALWEANSDCALPTEERLGAEMYVSFVLHSDNECTLGFMICGAAALVGSLFAAAAWHTNKWRRELLLLTMAEPSVEPKSSHIIDKSVVTGGINDGDDTTVEFDYVQAVKTTDHSENDYY